MQEMGQLGLKPMKREEDEDGGSGSRMLSAKKRRKRPRAGKPLDVGAQEVKDSVKSRDCVERPARKRMQNCIVESSSESEPDCDAEVIPCPLAGRLRRAWNCRGLQFSDPYDGDIEDASADSDCSLNYFNSIKIAPWAKRAPKVMALEDADASDGGVSFPKAPDRFCPGTEASEIWAVNDHKAPLELPSPEKDLQRSPLRSPELAKATEAFTSMSLTPDSLLLMSNAESSAVADLCAVPGYSAAQPTLPAKGGATMAEQALVKRKKGIPIPEGASEKLRRKKLRAALI